MEGDQLEPVPFVLSTFIVIVNGVKQSVAVKYHFTYTKILVVLIKIIVSVMPLIDYLLHKKILDWTKKSTAISFFLYQSMIICIKEMLLHV